VVLDSHALVDADCDQHPVEVASLTPSEVIERLEDQQRSPRSAFAMQISPPRW
jgi:hypothetical protein